MFSTVNLVSILRSLLLLFVRRRPKSSSASETTADVTKTDAPQGNERMSVGFDMQTAIAELAERIVEPVAPKLAVPELGNVIGQIRHAFEQLNTKRATADTEFEDMALNLLRSIQPMLSDAQFARVLDRLKGAMVGFCQSDRGQSARN
jgi:hypothetical protein